MLLSLCSGSCCAGVCMGWVPGGDGRAQQLSYTDLEEIQFPVQRGKVIKIILFIYSAFLSPSSTL